MTARTKRKSQRLVIDTCAVKFVHCWHITSCTTDGLAQSGYDSETCCHCGTKRRRQWVNERDPKHGTHVEVMRQRYP